MDKACPGRDPKKWLHYQIESPVAVRSCFISGERESRTNSESDIYVISSIPNIPNRSLESEYAQGAAKGKNKLIALLSWIEAGSKVSVDRQFTSKKVLCVYVRHLNTGAIHKSDANRHVRSHWFDTLTEYRLVDEQSQGENKSESGIRRQTTDAIQPVFMG